VNFHVLDASIKTDPRKRTSGKRLEIDRESIESLDGCSSFDEPFVGLPVLSQDQLSASVHWIKAEKSAQKELVNIRDRKRFPSRTTEERPQKRQKKEPIFLQNLSTNPFPTFSIPCKKQPQKQNFIKLHFHGVLPPPPPQHERKNTKMDNSAEAIPGSVKINNKILNCAPIPTGQGGGVSSNEGSIFLLGVVNIFLDHFNNISLPQKMSYLATMTALSQQKQGRKSFTHKDNTTLFNLTKAKTHFPELYLKLSEFLSSHEFSFPILINFALGIHQGYFQFDEECKAHVQQNPAETVKLIPIKTMFSNGTTSGSGKTTSGNGSATTLLTTPNLFKAHINHLIHPEGCAQKIY